MFKKKKKGIAWDTLVPCQGISVQYQPSGAPFRFLPLQTLRGTGDGPAGWIPVTCAGDLARFSGPASAWPCPGCSGHLG